MQIGFKRPSRVPFYAHPAVAVIVSAFGVIGGVGSAFGMSLLAWRAEASSSGSAPVPPSLSRPWLSLLLGCLVGLIAILLEKRHLRKRIRVYAELYVMPAAKRFRWSVQKNMLLAGLSIIVGPPASFAVTSMLHVAVFPALFGTAIMYMLLYPEYARIYEEARMLLASDGTTSNQRIQRT